MNSVFVASAVVAAMSFGTPGEGDRFVEAEKQETDPALVASVKSDPPDGSDECRDAWVEWINNLPFEPTAPPPDCVP